MSYPGQPGSPQYPQDPQHPQGQYPQSGFGQVPQQGPPQAAFGQSPAPGGSPPPPPQGGGYTQPPPGYGQPAPAKKKAPTARIVIGVVVAVVVVVIAIVGYVQSRSAPKSAAVGDCMHANGEDANSLKKVDCASDWNYKVVGKVDDVTESDWQAGSDHPTDPTGICHDYPSTTASFWEGEEGGKGYVLCLQARDSDGASPAAGG